MIARILIFITTIGCFLFSACSKHLIQGEGRVLTETRALPHFDAVELNGSENIEIVSSTENKVEITGYQNLIIIYRTDVIDGKLVLEMDKEYYNIKNNNLRIKLFTTGINALQMNGSGNAVVRENIGIRMNSSINGSGSITIGENYFSEFKATINGSGNINARSAQAEIADTKINGSGNISVTVKNYLSVKIYGSGIIDYWGEPINGVSIKIEGSGKVRKH